MIKGLAMKKVAKRYRALGTMIDLTIFGTDKEELLDAAFELIQHYEDLFTVNRDQSDLMNVNHAAGVRPAQVPDPVYQLTKLAILKSQENFGFNAAIGPLVKLWHIGFDDARLPSQAEIDQRLQLIDPSEIALSDDDFSIFLRKKGMEIDLGGIAKGYIADRVRDLWRAHGVTSGIINLGGNLVMVGDAPHHPDGLWRVGVRHPMKQTGESVIQLATGPGSVVTSGIAERHLEIGGKSYHHIIDPRTGWPHDNDVASVTVLTDGSVDGEIETTRLFFANRPPQDYGFGAIFVYRDKSVKVVNVDSDLVQIIDPAFHFREK